MSGLDAFCRRRLGGRVVLPSVSSQIDSLAIGYVKDTVEYIEIN